MDYSSNTSSAPACAYASLQNYNKNTRGGMGHPTVPATNVSGTYIVPNYGTIGYSALTHGDVPSCAGYFNIQGAYGKNAKNCSTQFKTRSCNN